MKKDFKRILMSALTATAFVTMSVGTTFALFTSEAQTRVNITSGKIEVSAALSNMVTYSAEDDPSGELVDERGNHYSSVATAVNGVFTNTGTAEFDAENNALDLERITPGDRVAFQLDSSLGGTNVAIKLRYSIVADKPYNDLVKVMDFTFKQGEGEAETYHGLVEYYSDWVVVDPTATTSLDALYFDISMPLTAGDRYQDLATSYLFKVEAIQANAVTAGEKSFTVLEEDIMADEVAADDTPTVIQGGESVTEQQQTVSTFQVTVPANANYGEGGQEQIEAGQKVELQVTQLETTQAQDGENQIVSLNFDAKLLVDEEVAEDFEEPIEVKIFVGENKAIASVKHKDQVIENYQYVDGYIIFETNSFSPFSVEYFGDGRTVDNLADLRAAVNNEAVKVISLQKDLVISTGFDSSNNNVGLSITRNTVILGNGHTLTMKGACTRGIWVDESEVTLELYDLTIKGEDDGSVMQRGVQVNVGLENVTIKADGLKILKCTYYALNVCIETTVNIDLDNCYIEGYGAINLWSEGYVVTIKNSTLVGINDKTYDPEGWNDFGVIVLEGDTTGETDAHADNCVVNLINCEIDAQIDPEAENLNKQYCVLFNEENAHNKVTATNCHFTSLAGLATAYNVGENTYVEKNCTRTDYIIGGGANPVVPPGPNPPLPF